jgi:putative addiction module killer protein
MIELRKTPEFRRWIDELRDLNARFKIQARIRRLMEGNPGDHKPIGEGVFEMRIHCGPGYRVYFMHRGREWVIVLAGGEKGSQDQDIRLALLLARNL